MLSEEEKSTNHDTWTHIHTVQGLLLGMVEEIHRRMQLHDQSKLSPPEVNTFVEFTPKLKGCTYGSDEYKGFLKAMKPALDNHYKENRHHPEHFENGVDEMNLIDLVEMLCDWKAATLRHDDGDIIKSIELNTERFNLSPQLVKIFTNTVQEFETT